MKDLRMPIWVGMILLIIFIAISVPLIPPRTIANWSRYSISIYAEDSQNYTIIIPIALDKNYNRSSVMNNFNKWEGTSYSLHELETEHGSALKIESGGRLRFYFSGEGRVIHTLSTLNNLTLEDEIGAEGQARIWSSCSNITVYLIVQYTYTHNNWQSLNDEEIFFRSLPSSYDKRDNRLIRGEFELNEGWNSIKLSRERVFLL